MKNITGKKFESVTLKVAGFYIKINLFQTEWIYSKNRFTRELLDYYHYFVVDNNNINSDYTIDIIEQRNFIYHNSGKVGLIELFKQKKNNHLTTYYQISIIQFQLLINNAVHYLLKKHNGCVLHASANAFKDEAIVFLGPTGQGKSTIMKLLNKTYPGLADDSIILREIKDKFYIFQTPTMEKESWVKKSSNSYLLKSIFFLGKKESSFHVVKLRDKNTILNALVQQLLVDQSNSKKQIAFLMNLLKNFTSFYSIQFLKKQNQLLGLFDRGLYEEA